MSVKFTPATMHGSQVGMKKDLRFTPALLDNLSSAGHSLKRGARFTPSDRGMISRTNILFSPVWVRNNIDPKRVYRDYTLDWWTDTAIFNYDALLVSAFYGKDIWDFREHYKIPRKDFLFVADSGGFQIWTQNIKIEPINILRWMEHNADIGMTLDVPPLKPNSIEPLDFEDFKRMCDISRRNYEIMHRNRVSEDIIMLKVLHGATLKELEHFDGAVSDYEFDGYAFSPKPPSALQIAFTLAYAHEHDMKRVHIFLGTGMKTLPVLLYAKRYFDHLTFDSASFSLQGARFRSYCLPFRPGSYVEFGKSYKGELKKLPCSCPVCQLSTVDVFNIDSSTKTEKLSESVPGGLIALHNLYVWLSYIDFLDSLSDSYGDYMAFLRAQDFLKTIKAIEFLRYSEEVGLDDAFKKYFSIGADASEYFV